MISSKIIALAVIAMCCIVAAAADQMRPVGGLEEEKPADQTVTEVLKKVQAEVEKKVGKSFESLKPVSYRTQLVAGYNYFIKAEATEKNGAKSHLHVRVYKSFRGQHELTAVRANMDRQHPIEYFD